MPPHSPLVWRSGGAEPAHEWEVRAIARAWFDSPHLHRSHPGLPLEARGFLCLDAYRGKLTWRAVLDAGYCS